MANKILVARGTKARIEAIKSTLATNELVYAVDTGELGVKRADGNVEYFMNARVIDGIVEGLIGLLDADNIRFDDSNTGLLTGITRVQRAIEELDRQLVNTGESLVFLFYGLYDKVEAIEDGTAVVKKAEQDEDGNSIKDTYATLADLATDYYSKAEIDDMIGDIDTALANILGV